MEHLEQHNMKFAAIHNSGLTVLPEEELQFLNVSQEDMTSDKPKNTVNLNIG